MSLERKGMIMLMFQQEFVTNRHLAGLVSLDRRPSPFRTIFVFSTSMYSV